MIDDDDRTISAFPSLGRLRRDASNNKSTLQLEVMKNLGGKSIMEISRDMQHVPVAEGAEPYFGFKDISFEAEAGLFTAKRIVRNVYGCMAKGEIMAIIGPSGSGKTTLLRLLSGGNFVGRKSGGKILNPPRTSKGMVFQEDLFPPGLTVFQVISFYGVVGTPNYTVPVSKIAAMVNLEHRLWAFPSSLSGGEKRRLSVACQLVRNNSILMLDEPTSGLSSADSMVLISTLRSLCDEQGLSIILTIHQPRREIFEQIDQLLVLVKGRMVFSGPRAAALACFGSSAPGQNDCDVIIDAVSAFAPDEIRRASTDFIESPLGEALVARVNKLDDEYSVSHWGELVRDKVARNQPIALLRDTLALAARTLFGQLVRVDAIALRLVIVISMALIIGTVYFDEDEYRGFVTSLFFSFAFLTVSALTALAAGLEEHELFMRDHTMGLYSSVSYVLSHVLSGIVVEGMLGIIFSCIAYWMVSYDAGGDHFFFYLLLMVTVGLMGKAVNLFAVVIQPSISGSVAVAGGVLSVNMLFCGFFVLYDDLPRGWKWAYWVSQWTYGFGALMVNEFKGKQSNCNPVDTVLLRCVENLNQLDGYTILKQFELEDYTRFELWGYYVCFYAFWVVFTMITVQLLSWHPIEWLQYQLRRFKYAAIACCALICCLLVIAAVAVPLSVALTVDDDCDYSYRNPELNGECGNWDHKSWGKVGEDFYEWHQDYDYDDSDLPNPREISNVLFNISRARDSRVGLNLLQPGFGQFLVHDIVFFKSDCDEGYINVPIPECDEVMDPMCSGEEFMRLCNVKRENRETSWPDLSPVYGTTKERLDILRRGAPPGELRMDEDDLLPLDVMNELGMEGFYKRQRPMMSAGDPRANSNLWLLMTHILVARNHNRGARILHDLYPDMDDDELFYTSRAANMRSWLNLLLDYAKGYTEPENHETINSMFQKSPNVPAGHRYGVDAIFWVIYRLHSMLPTVAVTSNSVNVLDSDYQVLHNYTIRDTIFHPEFIREHGYDNIFKGMLATYAKEGSTGIIDDLRNIRYFETLPCDYEPGLFSIGMDIAVVDIMRGRQLKIPRFNDLKILYGEKPYTTFDEFSEDAYVVEKLEELYKGDVNLVESYVGAHMTKPIGRGTHFTSTVLTNLLATMMRTTTHFSPFLVERNSDRDDILDQITVGSMRDYIILNTGLDCVPKIPNRVVADDNPLVCGPTWEKGFTEYTRQYQKGDFKSKVTTTPVK